MVCCLQSLCSLTFKVLPRRPINPLELYIYGKISLKQEWLALLAQKILLKLPAYDRAMLYTYTAVYML